MTTVNNMNTVQKERKQADVNYKRTHEFFGVDLFSLDIRAFVELP